MKPWEEYQSAGYKPGAGDRARFAAAASAQLGVPAEVIEAHAVAETGWNDKTVGAYNYGNIKAGKSWQGPTAGLNALEYDKAGRAYNEPSRFRAYQSPEEAAQDYADLIRRRYPQAAQASTPEAFAQALKAGGYATDPDYVKKFVGVARRVDTERGRASNPSAAETAPKRTPSGPAPWEEYQAAGYNKGGTVGAARDLAAGVVRGAGSIGATLLQPVDWAARKLGVENDYIGRTDRREAMDAALGTLGADTKSGAFKAGQIGTEIAGTLGAGGALAGLARAALPAVAAARAAPVLSAIETGGISSGGARGLGGLAARAAGGAAVGALGAEMMSGDSEDAAQAAIFGALLPVGLGAAGKAVQTAAGVVKPFTGGGQSSIVGDILRTYAHDPDAAAAALSRYKQVVPGSQAITSAAAGDVGLSGLTRTMQGANPIMANELAMRFGAQNAARTAALENIAGNAGTIEAATAARRAATAPLREQVMQRAGSVDGGRLMQQLNDLLADPNNAGSTARQALERVRTEVARFTDQSGAINPRALYEIRKDIGLAMQGKLLGDAGNLRYARGVLGRVQGLFDDAIGSAARRGGGSAPNLPVVYGQQVDDPWRDYLATYARQSRPIEQMERLQDILKSVQTGTQGVDGNLVISAAKLSNVLKKDGDELAKLLTPEQLQTLRSVAADAQAGRLGMEAGKAVGSNTAQNISQTWLLQQVFGRYAQSPVVSSVFQKPLGLLYGSANEQITDKLVRALLEPEYAAELMKRSAPKGARGTGPAPVAGLLGSDAGKSNAQNSGPRRGLLDD